MFGATSKVKDIRERTICVLSCAEFDACPVVVHLSSIWLAHGPIDAIDVALKESQTN